MFVYPGFVLTAASIPSESRSPTDMVSIIDADNVWFQENTLKEWKRSFQNGTAIPEEISRLAIYKELAGSLTGKSCGIVFNSGSLLNSQYGPAIDKNEVVIRFNLAPSKGYESFVGKKVTHTICGHPCRALKRRKKVLPYPYNESMWIDE